MPNTKQAECKTLISMIETLSDAFFFIDDTDTIVYANAHARVLIGATREELGGNPFWSSAPQLVSTSLYQAVLKTRQTQEPTEMEYTSPVTQGWLHVRLAPAGGGILLQFHERRAADGHQQLVPTSQPLSVAAPDDVPVGSDTSTGQQAEDDMRVLIDSIPHLVWIMRPDGRCDYCNQRWCDYTGLTFQQAQEDGWLRAIHPDDQQPTLLVWQHAVQTGLPYETQQRVRQATTGVYRWFLVRALPYKDRQGRIVKWVGTSTDIDEQKQAEARIKASEQNWHVLAETVPQLVWIRRAEDGFPDYFNQRFCDYTHATCEQLYGYGWSQFLHPDDYQRTLAVREHSLRTGIPYEAEYRLREGLTGRYRWFLARALPVRDDAGQIVKWFGTATDIDEQKRTEEALRQSQVRVRALIDSNIIGITSNEGEEEVIVEANDAWLHMTGYTREDVRSRMLTRVKITPPEQGPIFEQAMQEVAANGQHAPFETELLCKDGSRLPVLVGGVLFQNRPRQIVTFTLDNSARKELEQRKDVFIWTASHELRNPLTVLKLQAAVLHRQLAKQDMSASASALSGMETQINTITRLVEELLDVSKIQAGRLEYVREPVNLDALLREIADIMQHTHPSHTILIHGAVQTSLLGDRDRLAQVFINLLSNAIKYSPDAQTVEMDLSASEDAVTICVRDHGLGIPREQREKIFERFYRTADAQHKAIPGLGMGLYIVAEIVQRHGGTISVDSEVGKGTAFTVTLPRKRDA
ncbi:MAG TPA: PAS domain-containing sensor histidine kinase [Ktedonobacteraceae bacterium]